MEVPPPSCGGPAPGVILHYQPAKRGTHRQACRCRHLEVAQKLPCEVRYRQWNHPMRPSPIPPESRRTTSGFFDSAQEVLVALPRLAVNGNCLMFQAPDEVLVRPLSGASACGQANFFQSDRRRKQNASLAQVIDHHGDNGIAATSACRFPKRRFGDGSIISRRKGRTPRYAGRLPLGRLADRTRRRGLEVKEVAEVS